MDNLSQFFQQLDSPESLFIIGCILIGFLLGFLIAYLFRTARVRKLRRQLEETQQKLNGAEIELKAIQSKAEQATQDADRLRQEKQDVLNRLQGLEQTQQDLTAQLSRANAEVNQLRNTNRNYASTIEEMKRSPEMPMQPQDAVDLRMQTAAPTEGASAMLSPQAEERLAAFEVKLDRLEAENEQLRQQLQDFSVARTATLDQQPAAAPAEPTPEPEHVTIIPDKQEAYQGRILVDVRQRDDLSRIRGLGPFLEAKLNQMGVFTYAEIASWDQPRIQQVTAQIGYIPGRIERDDWVSQARLLLDSNPQPMSIGSAVPSSERPADDDPLQKYGPGKPFNLDPTDLKVIEGIDPEVEEVLKTSGVRSWADLANRESEELRAMLSQADAGLHDRDPRTWGLQARLASEGRWDELRQYQRELTRGI